MPRSCRRSTSCFRSMPALGILFRVDPHVAVLADRRSSPFPSGRCRTSRRRPRPSSVGLLDRASDALDNSTERQADASSRIIQHAVDGLLWEKCSIGPRIRGSRAAAAAAVPARHWSIARSSSIIAPSLHSRCAAPSETLACPVKLAGSPAPRPACLHAADRDGGPDAWSIDATAQAPDRRSRRPAGRPRGDGSRARQVLRACGAAGRCGSTSPLELAKVILTKLLGSAVRGRSATSDWRAAWRRWQPPSTRQFPTSGRGARTAQPAPRADNGKRAGRAC